MYKARSNLYLQQFSSICRFLMPCTVQFWKDMIFHEIFKVGACPTWKIPYYMTGFLSICTRQEWFGIFNNFPLSATLLCLVWYIFFGKKMIFHEIFQVDACPNLKDSSLYDRFSIHKYKTRIIRYLQQFYSIGDCLMPWTVLFFGKRWFFMKYFKLVHAPTWKIPYYMTGFLSISTRHETFGIFNIFPLSATPSCPVRYIFWKKMNF